jgi:Family of unknown function (DUF6188)
MQVAAINWRSPACATTLQSALGRAVTGLTVNAGRLFIEFEGGLAVSVDPDDHYEAWQINSEDGLLIVSTLGGELTIWYPEGEG